MPGALDKAFRAAAKSIVQELGDSLDTTIDYTRKFDGKYDVAKGSFTTFDRPYFDLKCPVEFIRSEEEEGREERQARIYIAPEQIGGNQPTMQDEIVLKFAGSGEAAQITNIETYRGGQEYLYILLVRF
tara:strand:- start:470 stop:856 length:387 start_codon:yes stop_codon:yes gene_type:complete